MRRKIYIGKVLFQVGLFVFLLHFGGRAEGADFRGVCQLAKVRIDGSTNVNQFHFYYEQPLTENFSFAVLPTDSNRLDSLSFFIPIEHIDASNPAMLDDFKELLKASQYPKIQITISDAELLHIFTSRDVKNIPIDITIAGMTNDYVSPMEVVRSEKNLIVVKGRTRIQLTDYNISPPRRFLGMIRVKDEVFINFDIKLITQKANSP
ncbi:YceI family protein [Prolixibacter sp. SD074]|uniref:YceI family protein n=1 Tax=Prolixibacter sp. SD074 TaxID=2652391 RepID=UPI00127A1918|nr:YceI family protein [Prolixibacter sp. SD074]GET29685.1 hypothetical protein SD074_18870 [Prolixibacter sp. SD074]